MSVPNNEEKNNSSENGESQESMELGKLKKDFGDFRQANGEAMKALVETLKESDPKLLLRAMDESEELSEIANRRYGLTTEVLENKISLQELSEKNKIKENQVKEKQNEPIDLSELNFVIDERNLTASEAIELKTKAMEMKREGFSIDQSIKAATNELFGKTERTVNVPTGSGSTGSDGKTEHDIMIDSINTSSQGQVSVDEVYRTLKK